MTLASCLAILHLIGFATALHAILHARTSQAAFAWAVGLVAFPYVTLPLYWVFGRSKFHGYVLARRSRDEGLRRERTLLAAALARHRAELPDGSGHLRAIERLADAPFTGGHDLELLVNGQETFDAIVAGIATARDYVLVEFYILRDDGTGRRLKEALLERARAGVRVYLTFDGLGSHKLGSAYLGELRAAGAHVREFRTTRGNWNRFQVNFRNHRKIVVVDGSLAFIGGLNVGDEYMGLGPLGPWRDTHLRIRGPMVLRIQFAWTEDWHWTGGELPELRWEATVAPDGAQVAACVPTGPADALETYSAYAVAAIDAAQHRVWIASPYFVPDEAAIRALQLAALRGVEVRVLIPEEADNARVQRAAFAYMPRLAEVGVEFHFFRPGFMHQKVILVDDGFASVGTANFDNRSFRLNFEIVAAVSDREFAAAVEQMLLADFAGARPITKDDYARDSLVFRLRVRAAYLLAQVM